MNYPLGTEVRHTPDLPPTPTFTDHFWWFANRQADLLARFLRLVGLY